jgi:hypothetical protein
MGVQPFNGKGPHSLLWAGSLATRKKITKSGNPNHLDYCATFIVYTQFTNGVAGWRPIVYGVWNATTA